MARPSIAEYAKRMEAFWDDQNAKTQQWPEDTEFIHLIFEKLHSEEAREVPLKSRLTFEGAGCEIAKVGAFFLQQQARNGGRAKKQDGLQCFIEDCVGRNPALREPELRVKLYAIAGGALIYEIADGQISFWDGDKLKGAALSGLKHRLSRAKKKPRAQQKT